MRVTTHAFTVIQLTSVFFFNDTATTEIYTLSLHDALPIWPRASDRAVAARAPGTDREVTVPRSELLRRKNLRMDWFGGSARGGHFERGIHIERYRGQTNFHAARLITQLQRHFHRAERRVGLRSERHEDRRPARINV